MPARMFAYSLALLFLGNAALHAQPAQVILIRHAEKPPKTKDDPNPNLLSAQGRERANLLVDYFQKTPEITKFGTPVAVYAQMPNGDHLDSSLRPVLTVLPLTIALKQDNLYGTLKEDYQKKMVDKIMKNKDYAGKMVLVCWEHNVLPDVAKAFVGGYMVKSPDGKAVDPSTWTWPGVDTNGDKNGDTVYDRTWVITYQPQKQAIYQNLQQPFKLKTSGK